MKEKSSKKNRIQVACAELECAIEDFKTIKAKKTTFDEDQLKKVKESLEQIKHQLEDFS